VIAERKVVITGLGAVTPAGTSVNELWHAALAGRTCGERITDFDTSGNKSKIGARIRFDQLQHLGSISVLSRQHDLVTVYALESAAQALASAGLDGGSLREKIVVCVGSAVGGVTTMERHFRRATQYMGPSKPKDYVELNVENVSRGLFTGFFAQTINQTIVDHFELEGFSLCPATGCTAGIDSIGAAADLISIGLADVALAGASEAPFTPIVFTAFDNVNCLSTREADPHTASCPFDRRRDGFLLSEGAGLLVLEEESHARKRGAPILGRLLGYWSNSNGYHMTALSETGELQGCCIEEAMRRSGVNPTDVSYFNAHGTSTMQNDRSETAALKRALGAHARTIPTSSLKSLLGHALGAASAIASVVVAKAIAESVVPPTWNYVEPDETCDLDYVPHHPREQRIRVAGVNASGFSGIHSTMFFSAYEN